MRCLSAVPHHDRGHRRAGNLENKVIVSVYKLMLVNFEQDEESRGETTDNNKVRVYISVLYTSVTEEREREIHSALMTVGPVMLVQDLGPRLPRRQLGVKPYKSVCMPAVQLI